uniref:Ribosomal protein L1 n=1 Tax=Salix viminalis TaxID=40686 RepID=A0A6N2MAW3_SALVM
MTSLSTLFSLKRSHISPELCLIIDDRPKSGLNKDAAKKKIQNDNIPISKIIKISKLKTITGGSSLPKMLGKQFFKKKKIPMTVDLKHSNWKEQIDKACGSALLFLRTGTCSVIKVGRVSMSREEISKNVMAAINGIAEIVPRKWGGIRSFHLKLLDSLALPVYQAVPDLKLKIDGGAKEQEEVEEEENKVKEGKLEKKGRIHEVLMRELGVLEGGIDNHAAADVENGSDELLKKKRKMGDNKGKGEKNVAKLKKEDGFKQKKANNEDVTVQKKLKKNALALESGEMQVKHNKKKKRLAA